MYKNSFLSNVLRAGKSQPFFSQNVSNTNVHGLNLIGPRVGITSDNGYSSSSWGAHGFNTSNTGTTAPHQNFLAALCSNDDNSIERGRNGRLAQRVISPASRRYSTGSRGIETRWTNKPRSLYFITLSSPSSTGAEADYSRSTKILQPLIEPCSTIRHEDRLTAFKIAKNYQAVFTVFESLPRSVRSLVCYNIYLDTINTCDEDPALRTVLEHASHDIPSTELVSNTLNEMLTGNVQPDHVTYNVSLQYFLRHRSDIANLESTVASYEFVSDTPQEAFTSNFDDELKAAKSASAAHAAINLFKTVAVTNCSLLDATILDQLLHACTLVSRATDAVRIFDHFDITKVKKSVWTYKYMIESLASVRDLSGAVECFNIWKRNIENIEAHDGFVVYDALTRAYFECGDHTAALNFFRTVEDEYENVPQWYKNTVAVGIARSGDFAGALEFVTAFADATSIEGVYHVVHTAVNYEHITMCRKALSEVGSHQKKMTLLVSKPNFGSSYLAGLIKFGFLTDALNIIRASQKEQIFLDVVHISSLISRCLDAGQVDNALKLFSHCVSSAQLSINSNDTITQDCRALLVDIFFEKLCTNNQLDVLVRNTLLILFCQDESNFVPMPSMIRFLKLCTSRLDEDHGIRGSEGILQIYRMFCKVLGTRGQPALVASQIKAIACQLELLVKWLEQSMVDHASRAVNSLELDGIMSLATACHDYGLNSQASTFRNLADKMKRGKPTMENSMERQIIPDMRSIFVGADSGLIDCALDSEVLNFARTHTIIAPIEERRRYILKLLTEALRGPRGISGDACLRLIVYLGRTQEKSLLYSVIPIVEKLVVQAARSRQVAPAALAVIYDACIGACNESNDNDGAEIYHDRVIKLGYLPSATSCASFVAKMDTGKYKDSATRALEVMERCRDLGVPPTEFLMNTVIAKLAKARRNSEALSLFEQMEDLGLRPNGVTYGTVINSCCRVGQIVLAERLFVAMERLPPAQIRVAPYNTLMQHSIQAQKDRSRAFFYWSKLCEQPIQPTSHSYRLLIEAHGHLKPSNPAAAESVLDFMRAKHIPIESMHYASIIHMHACILDNLPAANNYFHGLVDGQCPLFKADEILCQAMVEANVRHKNMPGMKAVLEFMETLNLVPNAYIINLAIEGYSTADELEAARSLFDQLPSHGYGTHCKEPSTYLCMVKLYEKHNMRNKSLEVLGMLRAQRYPNAVVNRVEALMVPMH